MDLPINIEKNSTLIVSWEDIEFDEDKSEEEIENKLIEMDRKYELFIRKIVEKYNVEIDYDNQYGSTDVIFPSNFNSLKSYIDMLNEVFGYLNKNDIPWHMNDIFFKFVDDNGGIININKYKGYIGLYYILNENTHMKKVKVSMKGFLRKI